MCKGKLPLQETHLLMETLINYNINQVNMFVPKQCRQHILMQFAIDSVKAVLCQGSHF